MFNSKLYKNHYPFRKSSDVLKMQEEEKECLIGYIKKYPAGAVEEIHKAWKYGCDVEGFPKPKGTFLSSNRKLPEIWEEFERRGNELIEKIKKKEKLNEKDLYDLNLILYSRKYNNFLSFFLFPTPGRFIGGKE